MNKLLAALIAGTFAASATLAVAQTPPTPQTDAEKARQEREAKFKATQQSMEKASNQMPAANVGGSTAKTATGDRVHVQKMTKEEKSQGFANMQKASGGAAAQNVGGTTSKTAQGDRASMSKMTKEQKAEVEKAMQKESKGGGG